MKENRHGMRIAALWVAVAAVCFIAACTPTQQNDANVPWNPWDPSITVSLPNRVWLTAQYKRSDEPKPAAGTPPRNEKETVTAMEATDSAARMLLTVFGTDPLTVPLIAQYEDDGVTGPRYTVRTRYTTQGDVRDYEVSLDATTGKAYRASIVTKDYKEKHIPNEALLSLDTHGLGAICLHTAKKLVGTRFVQPIMVDDLESTCLSIAPYAFGRYEIQCKTAVRTSGGESYAVTLLVDLENIVTSPLVQCVEVLPSGTWAAFMQGEPLPSDATPYPQPGFSKETVGRVYAALCGDAQTYAFVETKDELKRYNKSAEQMLALAERHPHPVPDYSDVMLDEIMADVSAAIQTAPEGSDPIPLDLILAQDKGLLVLDTGKGVHASFQQLMYPRDIVRFSNEGLPILHNRPVETPLALTQEEAKQKAESLFAQMGAQGFTLVRMTEEIVNHTPFESCVDDAFKTHAWRMRYVLPHADGTLPKDITTDDFDQTWENFYLLMDDTGVLFFCWSRPRQGQ